MRNDGGRVLRWAGHPGTLLAVLVLAFNDRVGKRTWPGAVTGKASDVAWMLVVPPVLALLASAVPRLRGERAARLGVAVTAVTFGCAKSSAAGAELASRCWSVLTGVPSRTVADRTDLLALPVLAVAWWLWRRSAHRRPLRRTLALVTVPLAVVSMAATSAAVRPHPRLWSEDGKPVAYDGRRWTSDDGGLSWRSDEGRGKRFEPPADTPAAADGQCLPEQPQVCFRLLGYGRPVEVSRDGGADWQEDYFPPGTARVQAPSPSSTAGASTAEASTAGTPTVGTSVAGTSVTEGTSVAGTPTVGTSTEGTSVAGTPTVGASAGAASAVAASGTPEPPMPGDLVLATAPGGGHTVVVHYPLRDGLLVRGTDGRWSEVDLPPWPEASRTDGTNHLFAGTVVSFVAGVAALLTGLGVRRLRTAVRPFDPPHLPWLLALRAALAFGWLAAAALFLDRHLLPQPLPVLWPLSALALAGTVLLWRRPPASGRGPGTTVGMLAVAALVCVTTFLNAFVGGHDVSWAVSCWWALCYAAFGSLATALIGVLARAPRSPYPPASGWGSD
ncbi:hypothetical protein HUT16_31230 [Kitasatospora sp. NA04385]|uniref:hypothetical protein n=1 Tax=Kitasatospora sp. NA04385 TaxID=2742135 RepID=UPI0015920223|nr:hypothetical protein [Kitasatospora sp. NA04385]QKW22958.1 hypothetical protein HUT16_31230 [Kitasatospora sp. NA04385]